MSIPNLIEIFDQTLLTEKPLDYVLKPKFKPSSLGSPCLRKIYYSYLRVPEDYKPDLKGQLIFRLGDAYGEILCKTYREAGILIDYVKEDGTYKTAIGGFGFDYEFPMRDKDLEISSKTDAVLLIDGKLWLGEWKSIGANGWKYLKDAKPEHKIQGAMYLYFFKEALRAGKFSHIPALQGITDVEGVIFLYWNKETNERRQYAYTDLSNEFESTIHKIVTVKEYQARNELPPKTTDWCQSCSFRDKCAKNFKPECTNT